MEKRVFSQIRSSVEEKRHNLTAWVETAPEPEKEICLTTCDNCVEEEIAVLDETLVKVETDTFGICEVCHGHIEQGVLEIDYTATICLDCLSETQRRELEFELEFSSEIQRALLPQTAPLIPGLEIGAFSRPAQIIGGDYFDFFQFKNGAHGFAIADVSGHGFSSSLLMSSLQTALHTLSAESDSVADVVHRINKYFLHNVNLTTFLTLFVGKYEPDRRRLTYANAGHNPPLLYHRNGKSEYTWLSPTGAAVGLMEDYTIGEGLVVLRPEDILFLYTDGVTELTNPSREFFGPNRLADMIALNSTLPAQELVSALRKGLDDFHKDQILADDVTMVAVKALTA
jgi:sigma-B regulation protein RsbU (phosphoserine phosphatase)